MKTAPAFLALLLVFAAAPSLHAEKIALYADPQRTGCSISETGQLAVTVYVFHEGYGTREAIQFSAPKPDCWTGATWVGDDWRGFGTAGQSQSGVEISYLACLRLPVYVGKIVFEVTGDAQPCCVFAVLPDPRTYPPSIEAINCLGTPIMTVGGSVVINENASCPCQSPLATDATTWGRIKSLYR